jgi:phage-related protein
MDPTRGAGIIRVVSPLGDIREIECYYVSGLEMDENPIKMGRYNQQALITFRAYDPYWRDVSDVSSNWQVATSANFFPIFPLRLTASTIAVSTAITNPGDVLSWPVWTITGPGGGAGGIVLQSITYGQSISFLTTTLGVGQFITIDTRPGRKTVTLQDGTNLFGDLDPTSALWPLVPGLNSINLQLNGGVVGTTALNLSYRPKYLSP